MKFSWADSFQKLIRSLVRSNSRRRRQSHSSPFGESLEPRQLMTVYAIDPVRGSDSNPGTLELPFLTPRHLSFSTAEGNPDYRPLESGDVVYLREGVHDWSSLLTIPQTYDEHAAFMIRGVHGTETAPVIIQAFPGEHPIVKARESGGENAAIYVLQSEHVKVFGLEVTGTFGPGIRVAESADVEIANNYVHDIDGEHDNNIAGIYTSDTRGLHIHHNLLHDNYDHARANLPGEIHRANSRNIVIFGDNSDRVMVDHNKVFNTPRADGRETGEGIWVKHASHIPGASFEFYDNIVHDVQFSAIGSQSPNTYMHHNLIVNAAPFLTSGGDNITVVGGNLLEYNTFVGSRAYEIYGVPGFFPADGFLNFQNNLVVDDEPQYGVDHGIIRIAPYGSDADYRVAATPQNLQFDDNVYFNALTSPKWNLFAADQADDRQPAELGGNLSFSEWQALGFDGRSVVADPQLDASFLPMNPATVNSGWWASDQPRLTMYVAQDLFQESAGANASSVTLVRSGMDLSQPLVVTLTTSDASEIQLPQSVTFAAGVSVMQVPIRAVDDHRDEPTRAVQIFASTDSRLESSEWVRVLQDSGTTPPVATEGVRYSYYEGNWLKLPNFDLLTPVKQGTSATFTNSPMNRDYQYGFRFQSTIEVPVTGDYTFYLGSDDGSRLKIGNTTVVDNDGLHPFAVRQGTIQLDAGRHAITVEFFESGGQDRLTVEYSGPGINRQIIPASALSQQAPSAPAGVVGFVSTSRVVNENAGAVTLQLVRQQGSSGEIDVSFQTRNGTATAGNDFTPQNSRVHFAYGETTKTIVIPLRNDTISEADESFTVELTSVSGGASLGPISVTSLTIHDDDPRIVAARVSDVSTIANDRGVTTIVIQFDSPMNRASVINPSAYQLRDAGRDGLFGTRDDKSLVIRNVTYDSQANTAKLTLTQAASFGRLLKIEIRDRTIFGTNRLALDGDSNGQSGGPFRRIISV